MLTLLAGTAIVGMPLAAHHAQGAGGPALASGAATAADVHTSMATLHVPEVAKDALLHARAQRELHADPAQPEAPAPAATEAPVVARLPETATRLFGLVGVTWEPGYDDAAGLTVEVRTRHDDAWSGWKHLDIDVDGPSDGPGVRPGTSPLWVGDDADGVAVRMLSADGTAPEDVQVSVIDGGTGYAEPALAPAAATTASGVARPRIVTRKAWGADNTLPPCDRPIYAKTMKGVVIHHTVGANKYTRAESPGIVRGIQRYHVLAQGWCDIGYNFLVDRYGTIYQGRRGGIDKQVRGAHAGNWDVNTWTTGISLMGNFDVARPTKAMKTKVVRLTAWRLALFGRRPFGTFRVAGHSMKKISGHRDVYLDGIRPATATACPGRYVYAWLNHGMRARVRNVMYGTQTAPAPAPSPTPTPAPAPEPAPEPTPEPTPTTTSRLAGTNRYATAATISRQTFTSPVRTVFVASGEEFPDALSAGPAAATKGAPVLLTRPASLPAKTAGELDRLSPRRIVVLGGTGAVSDDVLAQLRKHADRVVRLAGDNRYATGAATTAAFWSDARTVFLASGAGYADAVSGGALAAHRGAPIMLSRTGSLPPTVRTQLKRLDPAHVVLVGGESVLSGAVQAKAAAVLPDATVTRVAGADRYATSAAAARRGWKQSDEVYFATGSNFPDALAGVPAAAAHDAPLLLTRPRCLPGPVYKVVADLAPAKRYLLGGSDVVADGVPTRRCAS